MIKFLVMDVDGTLTDGKIYMGNDGEQFKAFDVKDGYGIKEILPRNNILPVIITARTSRILTNRCKELDVVEIHQGVRNKLDCLTDIINKYSSEEEQYSYKNVAYIGDDILDLQCMRPVKNGGGIAGCPADAVQELIETVDYVCECSGGAGAVREFIEYIVSLNKKYSDDKIFEK